MRMKVLDLIKFEFTIDKKSYNFTFNVNKSAKKEDAEAIGIVMQQWITEQLEELL